MRNGDALDYRVSIYIYIYIYIYVTYVTMVWVQIPSREEQKFDRSKI